MKSLFLAIAGLIFLATNAAAQPLPALRFQDLNGGVHSLPADWREHSGVLILGFAHNARDTMDEWVNALGLRHNDAWVEAPVVGNVSELIRPMIRTGMRGRYDQTRRAHVVPVFDGAEAVRGLATPRNGDVVVLVIDPSGQITARADGAPNPSNILHLHAAALH